MMAATPGKVGSPGRLRQTVELIAVSFVTDTCCEFHSVCFVGSVG